MPKFELVIDPPPYIRDLYSCEQATVRARWVARDGTMQRVYIEKTGRNLRSTRLPSRCLAGTPLGSR